jgi:hypothetical protein
MMADFTSNVGGGSRTQVQPILDEQALEALLLEQFGKWDCFRRTDDYSFLIVIDRVPAYPQWARLGPQNPQEAFLSLGVTNHQGWCYQLRLTRDHDASNWVDLGLWRLPAAPVWPVADTGMPLLFQRVPQFLLSTTIRGVIEGLPTATQGIYIPQERPIGESGIVLHNLANVGQQYLEFRDLSCYPDWLAGRWSTDEEYGVFYYTKYEERFYRVVGTAHPKERVVVTRGDELPPNAQVSGRGVLMLDHPIQYGEDYTEVLFETQSNLREILAGYQSQEAAEHRAREQSQNLPNRGQERRGLLDWLQR